MDICTKIKRLECETEGKRREKREKREREKEGQSAVVRKGYVNRYPI
jgi:hypothetical protein